MKSLLWEKNKCACICKRKLPGVLYFTVSWLPFYYFLFKSSTLFCTHNHAFMHDLLSLYPNSLLVGTQMKLLLLKNQVAWRNGSFCFLLCQLLPNPQHCSLWPFTVNLLSWCTVERVAFSSPWKEIISNTKYFLFTGATQNFCGFFFLRSIK